MINTDLSIQHEWIARRGFDNPFTLTFTDSGAFNTTSYTFVVNIRRIGGTTNVLQLTQGSGITNGGSSGIVTIQLTEANSNLIDADGYYYEIIYTIGGLSYGLLHGTLSLLSQYNNENINTDLTIPVNLAGTNVNMSVTLAGSGSTRVLDLVSSSSVTPNIDLYDAISISAQAQGILFNNPSGTPSDMLAFIIRIKDDGFAHSITFGNKYRAIGTALPTTTTISKVLYIPIAYNIIDDKYDCFTSQQQV